MTPYPGEGSFPASTFKKKFLALGLQGPSLPLGSPQTPSVRSPPRLRATLRAFLSIKRLRTPAELQGRREGGLRVRLGRRRAALPIAVLAIAGRCRRGAAARRGVRDSSSERERRLSKALSLQRGTEREKEQEAGAHE